MEQVVQQLKEGLDELCQTQYKDAEFAYIDAIRFIAQYRIMRGIEQKLEGIK